MSLAPILIVVVAAMGDFDPGPPQLCDLGTAVIERADVVDVGDVVLLSDGTLMLYHNEVVHIEGLGDIDVHTDVAAVALAEGVSAPDGDGGTLYAIAEWPNADFDLVWLEDGLGVLTITADETIAQFQVQDAGEPEQSVSCSAECTNGSCSQTCSEHFVCRAYCKNGNAVCECTEKPR